MASADPGTAEYSYYESMANQYSNLAEWIKNASDEVKEKYKNGGVYSLDVRSLTDSTSSTAFPALRCRRIPAAKAAIL